MKKISKILIFVSILAILVIPVFSFAQVKVDTDNKGLIPCGRDLNADGTIKNPCEFGHAMILINNVIKFVLFKLAMPIAAIMFAWAGVLMVTAGGSTERVGKARRIFTNVAIGFIIAVIAWLIVRTILAILGFEGDWIGFK